jgi:hypothetical protein
MKRLVPKEMIPDTLWNDTESALLLPPQLISSWKILLDKYGLMEKALLRAPEGFEGGMSKEDTDNHLAWRFTGSSARVMLPILDPKDELAEIPDVFARIFSGNVVFLADLPCGSGAASISILTVLCELRKQGRVPREPLHVVIIGGEISKYAQQYANEAICCLTAELEAQAITVEFEIMDWDVCDKISNTDLIKQLTLKSQNCPTKLLLLSNFSGFLQKDGKWETAKKQFDELFRHSRDENSIALWIEPLKNNVTGVGGFMPRLIKWFKDAFSSFLPKDDEEEHPKNYAESSAEAYHPLQDEKFRVNLSVVRFDLPLRRKL